MLKIFKSIKVCNKFPYIYVIALAYKHASFRERSRNKEPIVACNLRGYSDSKGCFPLSRFSHARVRT